MKKNVVLLLLCLVGKVAYCGYVEDFNRDIKLTGNNYYAYPTEGISEQTAPPTGYKPFYIDHYGRHGSRWHIERSQYQGVVDVLQKGARNGKLRAEGFKLLKDVSELGSKANMRYGELTEIGAEQHQGIAERMYKNYPEVLGGEAFVNAKSTIVVRCILSMENEIMKLSAMNPKLKITHDASKVDMYYLNNYEAQNADTTFNWLRKKGFDVYWHYNDSVLCPKRFVNQFFSDEKYVSDSIDSKLFMRLMFDIASNMQSHKFGPDFYELFTRQELETLWKANNIKWYTIFGPSKDTYSVRPYRQIHLLENMVESADDAISHNKRGADLRFGHEICLLPLAVLMGLNNSDVVVDDINLVAEKWQAYNIIPMGCNIQMVFYKKKTTSSDVLVKILLNEKEATLPINSAEGPYYRWNDVREYFLSKVKTYNEMKDRKVIIH